MGAGGITPSVMNAANNTNNVHFSNKTYGNVVSHHGNHNMNNIVGSHTIDNTHHNRISSYGGTNG